MDSLLATYASSDEDADETIPSPAPATRRGEASGKPAGGIFSALPQPKSAPIFSSFPAPKSAPTFSSIPPPKSSASSGNPKRVVQFRPPPIRQTTGVSSDEEDEAEKRRPSASEAPPPLSAGSGPVSSFLPAPRHSLGFGSGAARRSAVDTAGPERSNLGAAAPSSSAVNTGAPERPDTGVAVEDDPEESSDEDGMPAPQQQQQEQQGLGTGAGDVQQQGYDAGVGNATGYEGYAWDPNYYANYDANYGLDPSNHVNYETEPHYSAYGAEQSGGYGNGYAGEHSGGYGHSTAPPCGGEYSGGYSAEVAAMAAPPVQEPVLPPEMGRVGVKRGRRDMPMEIIEVNQAALIKNRPREDKSKLTGMAFGPSYQAAPSGKAKPSKLQKRKHQIGSLFYDLKQKEMELSERRAKGFLTKAETQAKYGW